MFGNGAIAAALMRAVAESGGGLGFDRSAISRVSRNRLSFHRIASLSASRRALGIEACLQA